MRFATIGSNFIVHRFLKAAELIDGLTYSAVYSRTTEVGEKLATAYGVKKVYTSLAALAADGEIDFVYIASPNYAHFQQARLMINHGKHVLIEKPITSNSKELAILIEEAKNHQVIMMEAMKSIHCPGFAAVKANLPRIGPIRQVNFNFLQHSPSITAFKEGLLKNDLSHAVSSGALMDIGCYPLHVMLALFGRPKDIKATVKLLKLNDAVVGDGAGILLAEYETFLATLSYSKYISQEGNVIQGELGHLWINKISDIQQLSISWRDGRQENIPINKEPVIYYEILKFVNAIKSADQLELTHTIAQMQALDDIRKQVGITFEGE